MKKGTSDWLRFWGKVKRGPGCWEWQACTSQAGYGNFGLNGQCKLSHRIMYEIGHGKIPAKMFVCHACDNPSCVRPSHLFLGTQKDNMMDASNKHRIAHGERGGNATLKEDDVIQIRNSKDKGKEVAKQYNISESTVSKIRLRRRWKHVK